MGVREDGALSGNPVTAPATVNESADQKATARRAWEGDWHGRVANPPPHESGDRPVDHSTIGRGGRFEVLTRSLTLLYRSTSRIRGPGGEIDMKNKYIHRAALACAIAPSLVFAQTEDPLDQIVVTGARSPVSVKPGRVAAVTSSTAMQIERREARNIAELLRSVPGFAVSQTGVAGSQTQVRVRGAEANHLLVLIDGVRATRPGHAATSFAGST